MEAAIEQPLRAARVLLACALLGVCGLAAGAEIRAEPEVQPAGKAVAAPPKPRLADPARIVRVTLDRPVPAAVQKSLSSARSGAPLQVGIGRAVAALASPAGTMQRLRWSPTAKGGQVAAFSVTSPEALSLRVGLAFESLPAGTLLRFYPEGAGGVVEVPAAEARAAISRNLDAGEKGEDATTYWSPVIEGASAVVEIELPARVRASSLRLAAPRISHLFTAPSLDFTMPIAKAAAASCNNDVTCESAWTHESNSVAKISFVDAGSSYICTGTLLADKDPSTFIPYFITANHCVESQAVASTLVSYWFYRASSCNSGVRGASQTLNGGATLLYSSTTTDTAFMRLNANPPAGVGYSGWIVNGAAATLGTPVASLHNPDGDLQKISFGTLDSYSICTPRDTESFTCRGSSAATATFYEVAWNNGITEPGSSGAGVFLENGHYLLGQLYGGTTSCAVPGSDFFGRFDIAFNAGLSNWLNVAPVASAPGDYSALWWNPAESGWGLSITQHNAQIFAAWFMYESGGNPRWVVVPGGTWTSATTFTGDVYYTTGPAWGQPWSPTSTQRAGTATLTFSSTDSGVLAYTVNGISGTKAIQRQPFGVPDATPVASYGDLWWNAAEPGWGISINQQYRTLFAVWYTYGDFGQPVWYVMPGGSWSGDTFSGALYRTSTRPLEFLAGAFDPASVAATPVGTLSLRFGGTGSAVMSYTVGGVSGVKAITRQPF